MLAFAWFWENASPSRDEEILRRLGDALCAGIGGSAGTANIGGMLFAHRPFRSTSSKTRSWRPSVLPGGQTVAFHGYFDNAAAIAEELNAPLGDLALLYGLAVARWGDEADLRIIGEYCAIIAEPDRKLVRLSRSPLRAPPLCYHHGEDAVAAASVPRALFAAGEPRLLNEARVADCAMVNFSDREASWFEGIARVPLGSIVELQFGQRRSLKTYYDPFGIPQRPVVEDRECLARVGELLDEGVRACLAGFDRPGVALSGGLDSPQVAARSLKALPAGRKLPTFTFHPEAEFDGRTPAGTFGDERPFVEAFAAMHPQIEPHFTDNPGHGHDHRVADFFHLMGGAPPGLCNMYVFHGVFAGAAREGCDVLLVADWGNGGFSEKGEWGFIEYLLKGRWRQLRLALRNFPVQERSMWWRFAAQCIQPLLPTPLWRIIRKAVFPSEQSMLDLTQPFTREYRAASGADQRVKRSGVQIDRSQARSARHARRLLLQNDDYESGEIYQAFEQMYGVRQRDPMAYRPLVEYCWSLPTRMFMRDGEMRWLAREMAKGIMPELQRTNRLNGRWDSDWHLRIGRRRAEYLAELDRLEANDRIAAMIDLPRMRAAIEDWPEKAEMDHRKYAPRQFAIPRALLTARFVNYVEGRNQQ